MGYRYPETLVEEFLLQGVTDKSTKILDMACGPGNVAFIVGTPFKKNWFPLSGIHLLVPQLREHGYTNIDGLDPSSGLLAAAQEKGISAIFNRNVHISNPRQRLRDIESQVCIRRQYALMLLPTTRLRLRTTPTTSCSAVLACSLDPLCPRFQSSFFIPS